ncbi:MAG: Ig domain-containing protein [Lachnospiraceae bacterium]|nr:Ig domain-containing protein [Lachnospiraceae bacterium]
MKMKFLSKKNAAIVLSATLVIGSFSVAAAAYTEPRQQTEMSEASQKTADTASVRTGAITPQSTLGSTPGSGLLTVEVTGLTLTPATATLEEGKQVTLTATVAPADATDKTVTWDSDNKAVATVSNGTVTAVKAGTANISAKAGNITKTCKVTVTAKKPTDVAVTAVKLDATAITLDKGKTRTLTATVEPANATNKTVTWTTSDAKVATVSNGTVTAVEKGTATITAKAGDKTATCTVTVNAPETEKKVPAKKVTLSTKKIYMVKGKSVTVKATVTPSDTTDKVTWSTSNKKVATVKNGKISAKKKGNATITAKAGSKKATVKVNVASKATKSTKVTLNKKKATIKVKKTLTLKATMKPAKSTDTLKWSSSNKKVAKVDKYGKVTAVKKGTATITVKTSSGKKATCKITVKK